jgi:hypothetical protein
MHERKVAALHMDLFCAAEIVSVDASARGQNGGYTRVRRTEGLLRSIIGAVVHGTRRRENPS